MKRLWIAVGILAVILAATLWNAHALDKFTADMNDLLTQAEAEAETGDWKRAESLTREARTLWERRDGYLHVVLRHVDTDAVFTGFREVQEFITCQEPGEYSAANARLMAQISLIYEAEQLNMKNVL